MRHSSGASIQGLLRGRLQSVIDFATSRCQYQVGVEPPLPSIIRYLDKIEHDNKELQARCQELLNGAAEKALVSIAEDQRINPSVRWDDPGLILAIEAALKQHKGCCRTAWTKAEQAVIAAAQYINAKARRADAQKQIAAMHNIPDAMLDGEQL